MRFLLLCILSNFACIISINSQEIIINDSISQNDGPYVLKIDSQYEIIEAKKGAIELTKLNVLPESTKVKTAHGDYEFDVYFHSGVRPDWKYAKPKKLLVLSDPHGDFEPFISVLQSHKVIDENFNWIYGEGHLMVIGDVFDRGEDVLPIYWLLYKLDKQALDAGGRMHFLYGNHEDMLLRNNLKYTHQKYKDLSQILDKEYPELWDRNSILGQWLRTRNSIEVIGDDLFVHAGIHPELMELGLTIPQINELISEYIGVSKKERNINKSVEFLFSNDGILWYRGLVKDDSKYKPVNNEALRNILKYFSANRIFVGHTIVPEVTSYFYGKVFDVNVDNRKNMDKNRTRGILIEGESTYIIYDNQAYKSLSSVPLE